MRINELEGEKKKLDNDLQRAMSQVGQLNKDRDSLLRNYESLKVKFEKYVAES
jgi:peptidoglycan hydrolase CwlO-like protein